MKKLSRDQLLKLKEYSKDAVDSLPSDHPWIHYLGSLDILLDTCIELYDELDCTCQSEMVYDPFCPVHGTKSEKE